MEFDEFPETPEEVIALAQRLQVRTREGKNQPLVANAVQRMFEERRGPENVVLKARQMGMTTWIAARFFLRTITMPGTLTLQVAHTQEAAESMFRTVRRMWQSLPDELREGRFRLARSNVRQMVFREIDSEIRVASAADENAGRGLSVQNLHCSEVSRWPGDAAATLAGLRATLAPNGECVMESTPKGAHGAFYEAWGSAVDAAETRVPEAGPGAPGRGGWNGIEAVGPVRHFFPWWMEPAYVGLRVKRAEMEPEELALVKAHGLKAEQIGFRRHLVRTYGPLRSQEFAEDAESCFRASGSCCFEVEAVEALLRDVPEPLSRRRNGALWVWLEAKTGREYMVAVDTAGGGAEGDFAAVQVVDVLTGIQCAELQQRLRPVELARAAAELAREYGGATVVVERNNHGAAVLAHLEVGERYKRVWRDRGGEAGWLTTASSKAAMIARLGSAILNAPFQFRSRRLLAECRTFVSSENGKMGASGGSHDDLVMAMAMAETVRGELVLRRYV